jgi:hypothetical protein
MGYLVAAAAAHLGCGEETSRRATVVVAWGASWELFCDQGQRKPRRQVGDIKGIGGRRRRLGGLPHDRLHCATRCGAKWMGERGGGGRRRRPDARRRVWRGDWVWDLDGRKLARPRLFGLVYLRRQIPSAGLGWAGLVRAMFFFTEKPSHNQPGIAQRKLYSTPGHAAALTCDRMQPEPIKPSSSLD